MWQTHFNRDAHIVGLLAPLIITLPPCAIIKKFMDFYKKTFFSFNAFFFFGLVLGNVLQGYWQYIIPFFVSFSHLNCCPSVIMYFYSILPQRRVWKCENLWWQKRKMEKKSKRKNLYKNLVDKDNKVVHNLHMVCILSCVMSCGM